MLAYRGLWECPPVEAPISSEGQGCYFLSSDTCKVQDIYRKGYLIISTTKTIVQAKYRDFQNLSLPFSSCKTGLGTCLTVTTKLAVTVFVKTCKVSFAGDISNPNTNKETKQSCEFHFLWFMKAAAAEQQESTLLGQPANKNNGEEKEPPPSATQKTRRLKDLQM